MTPVCCLFQGIKYLSPPLWCLDFELVGCPPTIKNCDLVAYLNYVLMLRMRIMHGLAFYTCISFLDLLQKKNYYELHGLKKQNFFSHIPENKSPISRWGQSHVPCEISRGESLSLLASVVLVFLGLWQHHSSPYHHLHMASPTWLPLCPLF